MRILWGMVPQHAVWAARLILRMVEVARYEKLALRNHHPNPDFIFTSHRGPLEDPRWAPSATRVFISGEPCPIRELPGYSLLIDCKDDEAFHPAGVQTVYIPFYVMSLYERKMHSAESLIKPLSVTPLKAIKTKFCAYMYSQCYPFREEVYEWMSKYKPVDALGRCKQACNSNRLLEDRSAVYPDGTTYNDVAVQRYTPYKFVLAVESASIKGYITEKMINPMLAHCIVIYFGAPDVAKHFNTKSFINVNDFESLDQCMEYVKKVDNDDELYESMLREPWLPDNKLTEYFLETNSATSRMLSYKLTTTLVKPSLFSKVFVINLTRRPHKWVQQVEMLDRLGWLPLATRVEAVDGRQLEVSDEFIRCQLRVNPKWKLKRGAIGCTMSHLNIWKSITEADGNVLVLEDDVDLTERDKVSSFMDKVHAELEKYQLEFDVLFLRWEPNNYPVDIPLRRIKDSMFAESTLTECQDLTVYDHPSDFWSTAAMVINKRGVDRVLEQHRDKMYSVAFDCLLSRLPIKKLYVLPSFMGILPSESDTFNL